MEQQISENVKDSLDKALLNIIEGVTKGVDASVDFLSQEIPEVINQLLYWNLFESTFKAIAGICMMIIAGMLARPSIWRKPDTVLYDFGENFVTLRGGISVIAIVFFSICGWFTTLGNILVPFKIWIAPKVWLIEYAAQLSK